MLDQSEIFFTNSYQDLFDDSLVKDDKPFVKNFEYLIEPHFENFEFGGQFKLNDDEIEQNFLMPEMVLDEDKEPNEDINEGIQEIKKNEKKYEKIFEITKVKKKKNKLPKYPRIDDYKILWRAKINKWHKSILNNEIKESDLPESLKKNIYSPNYKKFTEKIKSDDTFKDLKKPMSAILCLGKEEDNKRKENYENIEAIKNFYKENPNKSVGKVIKLLDMTYEEVIEKFYESKEFDELKRDEVAIFYDEELVKQKNMSLFEKNGLIQLFKSYFAPKEKNETMLGKRKRC